MRYYDSTIDEVRRAHHKALALYDRDGIEGARRRRDYCLQHHTLINRYQDIVAKIDQVLHGMSDQLESEELELQIVASN